MSATLLIGDIGGTNARFALSGVDAAGFESAITLLCADYESVEQAIRDYLGQVSAPEPDAICLAAAGPVVDNRVRMTNNHWTIDAAELVAEFNTDAVRLLNDFAAIAYSIPHLVGDDLLTIGLPEAEPLPEDDYGIAIVGPGTGLGVVGVQKRSGQLLPISGEASHGGFAPETQVQIDVLAALRQRHDRVSMERLVSGPGIQNIYWALGQIHGGHQPVLTAREIFEHAASGGDPRSAETVALFFEVLGQVAGDMALALAAEDGVFVAGGIARRYPEMMANSRFRSGFESKGRHRSLLERISTQLIMHEHPGLLGASHSAIELYEAHNGS